ERVAEIFGRPVLEIEAAVNAVPGNAGLAPGVGFRDGIRAMALPGRLSRLRISAAQHSAGAARGEGHAIAVALIDDLELAVPAGAPEMRAHPLAGKLQLLEGSQLSPLPVAFAPDGLIGPAQRARRLLLPMRVGERREDVLDEAHCLVVDQLQRPARVLESQFG